MNLHDGQQVTYIGPSMAVGADHTALNIGDRGKVLGSGENASHVLFTTGAVEQQILLVDNYDLAPLGKVANSDGLDDCLEITDTLTASAARQVFDIGGEIGVLNQMAEEGNLAAFGQIAEDAYEFIATKVRQDPAFRAVTAQLDDDEGEALIRLASHVLLRDAFGVEAE
jgi:hypothetical protein